MEHLFFNPDPLGAIRLRALTADRQSCRVITGARPGPTLMIVGTDLSDVIDRLMALPSLGWIRGKLIFVNLNENAAWTKHAQLDHAKTRYGPIDGTLDLSDTPSTATDTYWNILRFCSSYRVISGRGVPQWTPPPVSDQPILQDQEH
jgi:hypothetical protein